MQMKTWCYCNSLNAVIYAPTYIYKLLFLKYIICHNLNLKTLAAFSANYLDGNKSC